ncbi:MAG: glycoside hydrolase N-terminal domain-containing protein, partial [Verrucomicrobia bacterium]|nr:glycoside hydrolase N-terminal domain-containing protein [Verrucomicrobiota bacterium]
MRTMNQCYRKQPGLCAACMLAWLSATAGAAPTSSLVDDFDIHVNSTSSTWSYGTVAPASNPFVMKLLDTNTKTMSGIFSSDTALPVWGSTDYSWAYWMLGKNTGGAAIHNLWGETLDFQPGAVMLYPGQDGRNLLVSWLAPSDMVINANWTFTRISARRAGSQWPAGKGTDYRVTHRSGAVDTTVVGFAGVARPGGTLYDSHGSSFAGLSVKAGDRVFWEIAGVGGTVDVDATGADIAITADSSLSVSVTRPSDGQAFTNGASISATARVVNGTGPYRVGFFTDTAGGGLVQVGSTQNGGGPTFTQDLGAPAAGTYHVYATVTDSAGTPTTATSATNTFDVVTPPSGLTLWYDQPAGQWLEALPVGNGRLGGMVFGG